MISRLVVDRNQLDDRKKQRVYARKKVFCPVNYSNLHAEYNSEIFHLYTIYKQYSSIFEKI
jgi:hypothetical protein